MALEGAAGRIARYEIQKELGRGMMGVVYEAFDPDLDRMIALKTVEPAFEGGAPDGRDFERRFLAEARAAARLSHPGIVVIHDIGRDPATGALYIALERLCGRTLAEVLTTEAPLSWERALRIVAQVAEALHHAHEEGVVHRDVKPANIMLLPSDATKIMDFGIAKVDAASLTGTGQFFATPLYASPEQTLGHPVDRRSDVFSLGSVAYALLTGRHAFAAETIPRVLARIAYEDPPPPSRQVAGVPVSVDVLLARAMAKDPDRRFGSALSVAERIREILAERGAAPAPRSLDDELEELVGRGSSAASAVAGATWTAFPPLRTLAHVAGTTPRRAWRRGGVGAALLVPILAGSGWMAAAGRGPVPSADVSGTAAAHLAPVAAASALIGERSDMALAEAAELAIDLQHGLKNGRLRVWLDDGLLVEEELAGRVRRKVLLVQRRRGRYQESFQVPPGAHEIKVEVAWDDNVRASRIWGSFRGGSKRRLAARVGGVLRKNVALSWD